LRDRVGTRRKIKNEVTKAVDKEIKEKKKTLNILALLQIGNL
jgi:hypothetical protein